MGNFSRDTFDALKHYVGVRLQQGVPLVEADWNEQEDIRRFELEAFLKWFVGNGVPEGNDGFRITDPSSEGIIDFIIRGGDGTPKRAGRCLVDGWDVINESNIRYTEQLLFTDPGLAPRWGVDPLPSLEAPADARTDTVYLDVWEREVDSEEDPNLVNSAIGIETCVRQKREWVVRVETGATEPPRYQPEGHVFYPLAHLNHSVLDDEHSFTITDLRRTSLSLIPKDDIRQITIDAFGPSYTLDNDGQPNLKVSLRDAINAILRGTLPGTPELPLTTDAAHDTSAFALEDSSGAIWVFWQSDRNENWNIWYNRYHNGNWEEDDHQLTTDEPDEANDQAPFALEDSSGAIWVFWQSDRNENWNIWYNRYHNGNWEEDDHQLTTDEPDEANDRAPFALEDSSGAIWVFWQSRRSGNWDIYYNRYHNGDWESENTPLTDNAGNNQVPFALEDNSGAIWVFWQSDRDTGLWDIRYNRYHNGIWGGDTPLTNDAGNNQAPFALEDNSGAIWVFWQSDRNENWNIWYDCYHNGNWEGDAPLTTDDADDQAPFALEHSSGDICVFWQSYRDGNWNIWYKRCRNGDWEGDAPLTTDDADDQAPFALEHSSGDIYVFWQSYRSGSWDIFCRELIPSI